MNIQVTVLMSGSLFCKGLSLGIASRLRENKRHPGKHGTQNQQKQARQPSVDKGFDVGRFRLLRREKDLYLPPKTIGFGLYADRGGNRVFLPPAGEADLRQIMHLTPVVCFLHKANNHAVSGLRMLEPPGQVQQIPRPYQHSAGADQQKQPGRELE